MVRISLLSANKWGIPAQNRPGIIYEISLKRARKESVWKAADYPSHVHKMPILCCGRSLDANFEVAKNPEALILQCFWALGKSTRQDSNSRSIFHETRKPNKIKEKRICASGFNRFWTHFGRICVQNCIFNIPSTFKIQIVIKWTLFILYITWFHIQLSSRLVKRPF